MKVYEFFGAWYLGMGVLSNFGEGAYGARWYDRVLIFLFWPYYWMDS